MTARDRAEFEYRREQELRAAEAPTDDGARAESDGTEDDGGRGRTSEQQTLWVDQQVRAAMARGEFDDLPGAGKPLAGLDRPHDPDWWVKQLIEREQLSGVAPPALTLRGEDAGLDDQLDRLAREDDVRDTLESFNRRVVEARRQLQGGPPVVTPLREVEVEVEAWRERRRHVAASTPTSTAPSRRRWWRRRR